MSPFSPRQSCEPLGIKPLFGLTRRFHSCASKLNTPPDGSCESTTDSRIIPQERPERQLSLHPGLLECHAIPTSRVKMAPGDRERQRGLLRCWLDGLPPSPMAGQSGKDSLRQVKAALILSGWISCFNWTSKNWRNHRRVTAR